MGIPMGRPMGRPLVRLRVVSIDLLACERPSLVPGEVSVPWEDVAVLEGRPSVLLGRLVALRGSVVSLFLGGASRHRIM